MPSCRTFGEGITSSPLRTRRPAVGRRVRRVGHGDLSPGGDHGSVMPCLRVTQQRPREGAHGDRGHPGTRFMLMTGKRYGETPVLNRPFVDWAAEGACG